jgi:hypothetical protein
VTSFHHQPEAQHPKSSAIHKDRPADYPIYWHKAGICRHLLVRLRDTGNQMHDAAWNLRFPPLQLERYVKKHIVRIGTAKGWRSGGAI